MGLSSVAYPELVSGGFQNSQMLVAGEGQCQYCINTLIEKKSWPGGGGGGFGQPKKPLEAGYATEAL